MTNWTVQFHSDFEAEMQALEREARIELLAYVKLLAIFGPSLKRPHADTLKGSSFANMKELRFKAADGVWRVAFAFDPDRRGIVLVAGDKSGTNERRFYRALIDKADGRYRSHLELRGLKG